MIKLSMLVNPEEKRLLDDIRYVEYGEIYDVELVDGGRATITVELGDEQRKLVNLIRDGTAAFHLIKVHQGSPLWVDVKGRTPNGDYNCLTRLKF
jgi:hypothetical protein